MGITARLVLIIWLTVAMIATTYSGAWIERWLKQVLVFPASFPLSSNVLADALSSTYMAAVWLTPLIFFRKLRDIGSFRLPWTWTVLLCLPTLGLNLLFFGRVPMSLPWSVHLIFLWGGMATGVFEELVFRGYGFRRSPQMHPRLVILTSATCFALMHFINLTHEHLFTVLYNLPAVFGIGLAFGIIRMVSGSIAWCILIHGLTNTSWELASAGGTYQILFPYSVGVTSIASIAVLCLHPKLRNQRHAHEAKLDIPQHDPMSTRT